MKKQIDFFKNNAKKTAMYTEKPKGPILLELLCPHLPQMIFWRILTFQREMRLCAGTGPVLHGVLHLHQRTIN
jgi:hypothetical protein